MKHCLIDARTYAGTITQSDHRSLVTKIKVDWNSLYKKINGKKEELRKRINFHKLIKEENRREEYREKIEKEIIEEEKSMENPCQMGKHQMGH